MLIIYYLIILIQEIVFKFSKISLNLKNSGIILAIASKNNLADVKNFFRKNQKK